MRNASSIRIQRAVLRARKPRGSREAAAIEAMIGALTWVVSDNHDFNPESYAIDAMIEDYVAGADPVLHTEPSADLIDHCAQSLVSWEDGCVWPDSWDEQVVAAARRDAVKVLRAAAAGLKR